MKKLVTAAAAGVVASSPAWAGGFERSGVPLGFMFESGSYAELSYGYASPTVEGSAGGGLAPTGDVAKNYSTLGIAFKTDLNEKISLGFTIDPSFGADVAYPNPSPGPYPIAGTNATLNGDTVALIGRYKLNDNFSVHAGLRSVGIGGNATVVSSLGTYSASYANDRSLGYLVGAAYEKPEIAMRIALTYASETKHDMATTVAGVGFVGTEEVELPKSLTLDAQSGIAANTLLFGSIRWVDWTSTRLNSIGYPPEFQPLVGHDNDTITYTLGVGRKFSDTWSGAISIGYEDSKGGIATNLAPTDGFWSVGVGGTYTRGNMKISGGVRYVDIGDANALESPPGSGISNASFRGNSALGVGLKIGFTF
ncbi:outer membrane protein transport protein [Tabrizicola sp.]|uniref:outer membrane protein transport protein n=1 Tax=Tabrizicola sp. TaxID=2005166 RepID=UPI003D2C253B